MTTAFLLVAAASLGAVAFFEPCTIATHTLFSARAHAQTRAHCCHGLLALWLSRSALSMGLLSAVAGIGITAWHPLISALVLATTASVYLASRFFYLPVPHAEFFKLLPTRRQLPHAIQLGLTLPACTLPLFAGLAILMAMSGSIPLALSAGLLFASMFTVPTAIVAATGVGANVLRVLHIAAIAMPAITAALFYVAAVYVAFYRLSL